MDFYRRTATLCIILLAAIALPAFVSAATATPPTFSENLQIWDTGASVLSLQEYLNGNGFLIAQSGPGSPEHETETFGNHTYLALVRFQAAHGLPASGFFGPLTRTVANATTSPSQANLGGPSTQSGDAPLQSSVPNCSAPAGLTCLPGTSIVQPAAPGNGYTPGFGGGGGSSPAAAPSPTPDTTPPSVSLTAPSSGATVSGSSVTLTATGTDNVAVANVQFQVDGSNIGSAITSSPYTTMWNSTGVSDGSHTLYAVAEDSSGNYATSSSISVNVENSAPIISSIASSTQDVAATITWITNNSATSQVAYGATSAYGASTTLDSSFVISHSVNITGLTASTTYHFRVASTDALSHTTYSSDQTFTTYDAAAQTLFAAMTTPPTTAWKSAANTLILALKSASIWDSLDFLYLFPAGTAQAAYLNWKNPGTFTVTPVYTDRPIFVPYRGIGSNGSNSNFRTGFTPSVNAVQGTLNSSSLWTWVASSTPDRNSVQEIGDAGSTASIGITVRNASDNARILVNDLNNGTASVTNTDASGLFGVERVSSATKRLWRGNAQFGTDIARASIAMADAEIYINGVNSITFNTRQLQMAAYGANLVGKETAFNNAMNTFMQAVVPASGGRFWTAGDSYMHGSGGTTNVSMSALLNYTTGRVVTDVSAGGTTLAQQRDAILARTDLYGLPLVWWDGLSNGHVDTATDLAIVDQVLAVIPASQIIFIPSVVVGPPTATTTATLSDMQAFRAGLIARGVHTIDMQSVLVPLNNTGSDAPSTAAGLVGPSLTQDGTHLIGSVMDTAVVQVVPILNGL